VSIGEVLAEARRLSGLTVTEVSERTRIRETIIRGIERDSYAGCGGDFYARGFIRSIARAVGTDPGPLIRDYEAAHPAPPAGAATGLRHPVSSVRMRRIGRPNVTALLALALAIAVGFVFYQLTSTHGQVPRHFSEKVASGRRHAVLPPGPAVTASATPYAHEVVVRLTAIEDCWVEFTTPQGGNLFQSYVVAGASRRWIFRRAVDMRLGNPGGVKLIVDGKKPLPPGTSHPITLRLGLHGSTG
jgi:transcriptional regulator with XRE-family HTH domain